MDDVLVGFSTSFERVALDGLLALSHHTAKAELNCG